MADERDRLRETNPFTILEYIKTSIEILMNMKMEEHEEQKVGTSTKRRRSKPVRQSKRKNTEGDDLAGDAEESESVVSGDEAPSEYESML